MASPFTTGFELMIMGKSYRSRPNGSYPSFVDAESAGNLVNAGKLQCRGDVRQTGRVEKDTAKWENCAQETMSALQNRRTWAILSKVDQACA
jgi:hypothetical protein